MQLRRHHRDWARRIRRLPFTTTGVAAATEPTAAVAATVASSAVATARSTAVLSVATSARFTTAAQPTVSGRAPVAWRVPAAVAPATVATSSRPPRRRRDGDRERRGR